MVKSLVTGLCLAVLAAAVIALSETLSLDLEHVALFGAALGGVLGLVGHRPGWGKVAGFGVGFLVTNLLPLQQDSAVAAAAAERENPTPGRHAERTDRRSDRDDQTTVDDLVTGAAS